MVYQTMIDVIQWLAIVILAFKVFELEKKMK